MKIDLSIIIVNYNTKQAILDCIDSIVKSVTSVKYEIVIIDNASVDGSVESLRKLEKSGLVKFIENGTNVGFSKAVNQGIKISSGKYKLLLNSDTKLVKGALLDLIKFAQKTPDAGVIGGRLLNPDGSVQPSCFRTPTIIRTIKHYWLNEKGVLDKYTPSGNDAAEVDTVVGAFFLITPYAIQKVGLLNEKYFMYFEDHDYCRKVRENNLKVYYLPSAKAFHLHGLSGKNITDNLNQWRRLIPSSKAYHGVVRHYIIQGIIWTRDKWEKLLR